MRAGGRWANPSARQIAERLVAAGFAVGRRAVRRLPRRHRPGRDAQFLNIARPKGEYLAAGEPVVSTDTKKRDMTGDFFRPGTVYATGPIQAYDHGSP